MTPSSNTHPAPPPDPARQSVWARVWDAGQFVAALAATVAALAYLLVVPVTRPDVAADDRESAAAAAVQAVGPGLVRIDPATPLGRRIQIVAVHPTRLSSPVLIVTGTVAASLRPGGGREHGSTPGHMAVAGAAAGGVGGDYWQFNTPEVLTAYTDWQKAIADIAFTRTQLAAVRELAAAKLKAQQEVVDRLVKTVEAGTDPKATLSTERANLIQVQIQGRKDVYEAESAVRVAQRNEAAAARLLQQAGLDPAMLASVTSDVDIVMADVPETYLGRVKVGQGCQARFFGIPDQVFAGRVQSIAPVVSKERRSLRVLFTVDDLKDQLRPGMFAEIGLGTDARDALLVPAEGVVHVGRADYVLVGADAPDTWRVTEVRVGEVRGAEIEVLAGVRPGDRVLGQGAVLLKPFIVAAAGGPAPPGSAGVGP
ncbi:MAG: efflux transporter, family, subunit [Gemmataceae bacterium]|nr:efflux transporter, family, subunit [Gemmataceae bacterium]